MSAVVKRGSEPQYTLVVDSSRKSVSGSGNSQVLDWVTNHVFNLGDNDRKVGEFEAEVRKLLRFIAPDSGRRQACIAEAIAAVAATVVGIIIWVLVVVVVVVVSMYRSMDIRGSSSSSSSSSRYHVDCNDCCSTYLQQQPAAVIYSYRAVPLRVGRAPLHSGCRHGWGCRRSRGITTQSGIGRCTQT